MQSYTQLTSSQIEKLEAQGCTAQDWGCVQVSEDFHTDYLRNVTFGGEVRLGANGAPVDCGSGVVRAAGLYHVALFNTVVGDQVLISNVGRFIANYRIEDGALIENVGQISCNPESTFGNGVEVSVINEGGGREVTICDGLTAQIAYILAMYRHRTQTVERLRAMIERQVQSKRSSQGVLGRGARVVNTSSLVDIVLGDYGVIDGASSLCNGTINSTQRSPSFVGSDVAARDFILTCSARVDTGAMLRSCFVGEGVVIENGFSAEHSLFFANSHCTHGEACAVFAGPYTVTHHRATLLIAGYFSFFNAGSGANQSNHMYKAGPVHQGIHLRGCKFSSDAYILLPAHTGVFTVVKGRHYQHHDTDRMPFSYLIEEKGESYLLPGMNLRSYGTARDIGKWPRRDIRRGVAHDLIRYELMTPYTAGKILQAIRECEFLLARYPAAEEVTWNRVKIKTSALRKGLRLYQQGLRSYLGELLTGQVMCVPGMKVVDDRFKEWVDLAGMIAPAEQTEQLLDRLDAGEIVDLEQFGSELYRLDGEYEEGAQRWGVYALEVLLHKSCEQITDQELSDLREQAVRDRASLEEAVAMDAHRDFAPLMAVGYGIDSENFRAEDFRAVRGEEPFR